MAWRIFIALCALTLGLVEPGFAQEGNTTETAEQFLKRYLHTISAMKKMHDLEPFLADEQLKKMNDDAGIPRDVLENFAVTTIKSMEPSEVRIESQVEDGDKTTFQLAPAKIPSGLVDAAKSPTFEMRGKIILTKANGDWKVNTDRWTVHTKGPSGETNQNFGFGSTDGASPASK